MATPDFSHVTSLAQAEELARGGQLEKLLLLPAVFGGADIPPNTVYVPVGIGDVKRRIDEQTVAPLVRDGVVTQYAATPQYARDSFIPTTITVVASNPGSFTATINVWETAG